VPAKPSKVETKKPTLPPIATSSTAKSSQNTEIGQSPLTELPSAKPENKGKRSGNESTGSGTPVTSSANPISAPKGNNKSADPNSAPKTANKAKDSKPANSSASQTAPPPAPEPVEHAPIVARQTKKSKPQQLPKKKQQPVREDASVGKENTPEPPSTVTSSVEPASIVPSQSSPTNVADLLAQLSDQVDLQGLKFFNPSCLKATEAPEYRPIVEALTALATIEHSSKSPASMDSAKAAMQQLLDGLAQTIADLLQLLPQSTWGEDKSFDGILEEIDRMAGLKSGPIKGSMTASERRARANTSDAIQGMYAKCE
jgi:hypothetical protein